MPAPKLDRRDANAVVERALQLARDVYVPAWTQKAGDPGRDLVDLFGQLMEVLIERFNRVPDRNFLAFLELAGVERFPGHAASVPVTFLLSQDASGGVAIGARTRIATTQSESSPAQVFEVRGEFLATAARLEQIIALAPAGDGFVQLDPGEPKPKLDELIPAARAARILDPLDPDLPRVERFLYLADERLFGNEESVDAVLELTIDGGSAVFFEETSIRWTRFDPDAKDWVDVQAHVDLSVPGLVKVRFDNLLPLEPVEVGGHKARWIAARPAEPILPATPVPTLRAIQGSVLTPQGNQTTVGIDHALSNARELDFEQIVYPFGTRPRFGDALYLGSRTAFAPDVEECVLDFEITPYSTAQLAAMFAGSGDETITTVVRWEYLGPDRVWKLLGEASHVLRYTAASSSVSAEPSAPTGSLIAAEGNGAFFGGLGLLEVFSISIPSDIALDSVYGRKAYWIRAVLTSSDPYGQDAIVVPGAPGVGAGPATPPVVVGPTFVPPVIVHAALHYGRRGTRFHVSDVLTHDAFVEMPQPSSTDTRPIALAPFVPLQERAVAGATLLAAEPALYLGFDRELDNGFISLFVHLDERTPADRLTVEGSQPTIQWEYLDVLEEWKSLDAIDETENLTGSGVVAFPAPADMGPAALFPTLASDELAASERWIRGRLLAGGYNHPPRLLRVLLNTVMADRQTTALEEVLVGSSNGEPDQAHEVVGDTILAGELWVREPEPPGASELAELLGDLRRRRPDDLPEELLPEDFFEVRPAPAGEAQDRIWVRWIRVPNLFSSTPRSRHYTLDQIQRVVRFGDGERGRIPPATRDGLVLHELRRGGGERANDAGAPLAVKELLSPVPFVDQVFNVQAAVGGSNPWTQPETFLFGPQRIKNRGRAVTTEDYEWMVRERFGEIAYARCIPVSAPQPDGTLGAAPGAVTVVVVPRGTDPLPRPSRRLLTEIERFLGTKMVGTIFEDVHAVGPVFRQIDVAASVRASDPRESHRVRRRVEIALEAYLHPLTGGLKGNGWEFGRGVPISEVHAAIERTSGVHHVATAHFVADPSAQLLLVADNALAASGSHRVEVV